MIDSIDCSIYGVMANQQLGLMAERMVTLVYDAIWQRLTYAAKIICSRPYVLLPHSYLEYLSQYGVVEILSGH